MNDPTTMKKIIRRKAKRIKRARIRLIHMRNDIEKLDIREYKKECILKSIEYILLYLQNDDMEENKYNYDNFNG